ncbi:MAG: F0F1 ATP synthase subunit delta [Verrucomicrobia bacterium]|nr:F0F1 ATP synthase subunit delta [Verrucomicrobiota bacterium]
MKISKQSRRTAKQLLRGCVQESGLDEDRVRRTVSAVIEKKPRGYFGILSHFHRLVKLEVEKRTARVESAADLAPEFQSTLQSSLNRKYGAGLHITFVTNPDLLGGLRIQVGSDVYDGSLQGRLNRLRESF